MARAPTPDDFNASSAVAKFAKYQGASTSKHSPGVSPALAAKFRKVISSESANGPGASGGGAGSRGRIAATSEAASMPSG